LGPNLEKSLLCRTIIVNFLADDLHQEIGKTLMALTSPDNAQPIIGIRFVKDRTKVR
jgi:hypothetical protein